MSQIEVDKVIPQSGTALQVGDSGDTITIPAGATITNNGTANGFGSADTEKVKVSANDTTAGFLNGKLVAGTNISLTEGTDGGNETLTAALSGTIATAQIADDAVTLAKMAPGTDGNIISYDASGNPVAVATGTAGQVLTSAGAGAPPTFAAAGGITEADQWRLTADFNPSGSSADITANLERNDSGSFGYLGSGMSQSSGIFTFPSTGVYFVSYQLSAKITSGTDAYLQGDILVTADNSNYVVFSRARLGLDVDGVVSNSGFTNTIVDVTNTSNVKVKFDVSSVAAASVIMGESTRTETGFTFIRLGDT